MGEEAGRVCPPLGRKPIVRFKEKDAKSGLMIK